MSDSTQSKDAKSSAVEVPAESDSKEQATKEPTTSVSRSYSDLDPIRFVFFVIILCALRTAAQHPLNLALARKQSLPRLADATTKEVLFELISKEGWRRGLTRGIVAFVGGTAASEGIYLVAFELLREYLPISYSITREAVSGYIGDAMCRSVHIPLMVVAYRQMAFELETQPPTIDSNEAHKAEEEVNVKSGNGETTTAAASATSAEEESSEEQKTRVQTADTHVDPALMASAEASAAVLNASHNPLHEPLLQTPKGADQHIPAASIAVLGAAAAHTQKRPLFSSLNFKLPKVAPVSARPPPCPGIRTVTKAVYREGGIRALYAGMGTTLLIGCQWSGVWWAMYGYLKYPLYEGSHRLIHGWDSYNDSGEYIGSGAHDAPDRNYVVSLLKPTYSRLPAWMQRGFNGSDNMLLNGMASVAASGLSAVIFNPFLVVRARMQVTSGLTLRQAIVDVFREGATPPGTVCSHPKKGSFKGFFSGLRLSVALCILDGVLSTFCYEYSKLWSDVSAQKRAVAS